MQKDVCLKKFLRYSQNLFLTGRCRVQDYLVIVDFFFLTCTEHIFLKKNYFHYFQKRLLFVRNEPAVGTCIFGGILILMSSDFFCIFATVFQFRPDQGLESIMKKINSQETTSQFSVHYLFSKIQTEMCYQHQQKSTVKGRCEQLSGMLCQQFCQQNIPSPLSTIPYFRQDLFNFFLLIFRSIITYHIYISTLQRGVRDFLISSQKKGPIVPPSSETYQRNRVI